jgi:hypothetical protein
MRNEPMRLLVVMIFIAAGIVCVQSTPLTYQGQLQGGGKPANGNYDFQFRLAKSENGYVGPGVFLEGVTVTNGLFTAVIDFGTTVFDGSDLWLEIGVRTSGSDEDYSILSPRQPITAAPYAIYALAAGSANGGPSGTNGIVLTSGSSNVLVYATNTYVATAFPDTNWIYVSGAGRVAANGVYGLKSSTPTLAYTNISGMRFVYFPDDLADYVWEIIDPAGVPLYGAFQFDFTDAENVGLWSTIDNSARPRPSFVSYGTNYFTNYTTQVQFAGASIPAPSWGNDIYVNSVIGNDLFARRGRPDLAYKTVYAALKAATNDDTILVAPGIYNETPFKLRIPPGVKLVGAGKRITRIDAHPNFSGEANFDLSSSNVLSGFSTDFVISLGGYTTYPIYGAPSNVFLQNIEARGIGDVVYLSFWRSIVAEDCTFISQSDCFVDFQSDPLGSNAVAELHNCVLKTEGSGILSNHGLANGGRSQIRMFGGSIDAQNAASSVCVWAPGSPPGGSIELSGVALRYGTTNTSGRAYAILNNSGTNCHIIVNGMLVNVNDVYGPIAYVGNLYSTNVIGTAPANGNASEARSNNRTGSL